jgi:hypothetical protein
MKTPKLKPIYLEGAVATFSYLNGFLAGHWAWMGKSCIVFS